MADDHQLTFEVAVRAGLDAVWQLLATSEGRAAWFGTEAEIDLVVGGASRITWDGQQPIDATVTHLEPRRHLRLAYVMDGEELGVEEYWLDHEAGVTTVRLVQVLPPMDAADVGPETGSWDGWYGDLERGWRLFLASLRYAAERDGPPERVSSCRFVPAPGGRPDRFAEVLTRLGLDGDELVDGAVVDVAGMGSARVQLAAVPHGLLLATADRTLLVDLEGTGDGQVLFAQAATHGAPPTDADATWRAHVLDRVTGG